MRQSKQCRVRRSLLVHFLVTLLSNYLIVKSMLKTSTYRKLFTSKILSLSLTICRHGHLNIFNCIFESLHLLNVQTYYQFKQHQTSIIRYKIFQILNQKSMPLKDDMM